MLQQDLNELKLQAKLGKVEAADYLEEKKHEFSGFIDDTKENLKEVTGPAKTKAEVIHQSLDELKLQLKLGRMESRDAYAEQKGKIASVEESHEAWENMKGKLRKTMK